MFHYSEKGMLQYNCKLNHLPSSLGFHCRGFPLIIIADRVKFINKFQSWPEQDS